MKSAYWLRSGVPTCLGLVIFCLAWSASPAGAATRTVTTYLDRDSGSCAVGDCSLREAVKYAGVGDTVVFSQNGTFTISAGLGPIEIDKNLTITGRNTSLFSGNTLISGGGTTRIFHIASGTVLIHNLVLTQGYTETYSAEDPGGGGILNAGSLTLDTVVLTNCLAHYKSGGAVYSSGPLTLNNCYLAGNEVDGTYNGGAVAVHGTSGDRPTVNITDTLFWNNDCAGNGGAVRSHLCDTYLTRCTFQGNIGTGSTVGGGGAVSFDMGAGYVTDCTFQDNVTLNNGGAIQTGSAFPLAITGCTFSGNTSGANGGALRHSGGKLLVVNSTFSGNQANKHGGAIWVSTSDLHPAQISFTTITGNTADADCGEVDGTCLDGDAGGFYLADYSALLRGVILAGNTDNSTSGTLYNQCYCATATAISAGYNLVGTYVGCAAAFPSGLPNVNQDYVVAPLNPLLGALADNGGPTETCRPQPNSLAVNHGPPDATDANGDPVTTDQRGRGRVRGGRSDIGAYELEIGSGSPLAVLLK